MIVVLAGTNRPGCNTLKVAEQVHDILEAGAQEVRLLNLQDLPPALFEPASYGDKPEAFAPFQDAIRDADGILTVLPEYNGSFPGVLKYFIDMLKFPESLAGIVALSTFVTLESSLASEVSEANREIPIFMAHGEHDPLIPVEMGRLSRQKLESLGYSVGWHEYPMQHAVCPQEIGDIGKWLRARLAVS